MSEGQALTPRLSPRTAGIARRGLLLGMAWLNENLQHFAVRTVTSQRFDKHHVAQLKPLTELALTVWMLKRCGLELPVLDATASWIWQQCEHGRKLVALLLARHDFLPCCALYASLRQLGFRDPALDRVLRLLARADIEAALPLQPWSRLAMRYNLWQLGLTKWPGQEGGLYIATRPEPWVVSGEVAYAITHEVFYLTDFGARELEDVCVTDYLRAWLPYWTRAFVDANDNDLAAELAMVAACLQASHDPASTQGLHSALAVQREDGAVPGPDGAGSFLFAEGDTAAHRDFLGCYHTTLVTLMAAAMTLRNSTI